MEGFTSWLCNFWCVTSGHLADIINHSLDPSWGVEVARSWSSLTWLLYQNIQGKCTKVVVYFQCLLYKPFYFIEASKKFCVIKCLKMSFGSCKISLTHFKHQKFNRKFTWTEQKFYWILLGVSVIYFSNSESLKIHHSSETNFEVTSDFRFSQAEIREWWEGWIYDCPR